MKKHHVWLFFYMFFLGGGEERRKHNHELGIFLRIEIPETWNVSQTSPVVSKQLECFENEGFINN